MDLNPQDRSLGARVAAFIRRSPWLSIGIGLLLFASAAGGLARLRADFTYSGYFYPDDPWVVELESFERRFGNDDAVVVAVHSPSGIFDLESMAMLRTLTD